MARVWRSIKDIDDEKNGFLSVTELQDCFIEHFAPELEGKSLVYFFRRWSTDHDKELVNYRRVKETIMEKIYEFRTPVKDTSSQSSRFMSRSITQSALGSSYKQRMEIGGGRQSQFESFVNKPMKASAAMLQKAQDDQMSQMNGVNEEKLPKLNRYNVRTLG